MADKEIKLAVSPPKLMVASVRIVGDSPLVLHNFSQKQRLKMEAKQKEGSQGKTKIKREARNFEEDYEASKYVSADDKLGLPAGAFRTAMIDCCRLVGFKMTMAKMSVFVEADGFDKQNGTPLVYIDGEPEETRISMKNDNGGADVRVRPMWRKWAVNLRIRFDEDQFSLQDVINLLLRAGVQCGVGEGRPNSRESTGCGWGCFSLDPSHQITAQELKFSYPSFDNGVVS